MDERNKKICKMLDDCLKIVYKIDPGSENVAKILKLKRIAPAGKCRKLTCEISNVALWVGDVLNDLWLRTDDYFAKREILKLSKLCFGRVDAIYAWSWPKLL